MKYKFNLYLFLGIIFLITLGCSHRGKQLTGSKLEKYNKRYEILKDSFKIILPEYKIVDTSFCSILESIIKKHTTHGYLPIIIEITPIVINDDSIKYHVFTTEFFSSYTLKNDYNWDAQKRVSKAIGVFFYNQNIVILNKLIINKSIKRNYDYLITTYFEDTKQTVDFYPRFGIGQLYTDGYYLYKNGVFKEYEKGI